MKSQELKFRVDRTALTVTRLQEDDTDIFWLSKSTLDRIEAIEINRQVVYGYGPIAPRLQRLLEVARR